MATPAHSTFTSGRAGSAPRPRWHLRPLLVLPSRFLGLHASKSLPQFGHQFRHDGTLRSLAQTAVHADPRRLAKSLESATEKVVQDVCNIAKVIAQPLVFLQPKQAGLGPNDKPIINHRKGGQTILADLVLGNLLKRCAGLITVVTPSPL